MSETQATTDMLVADLTAILSCGEVEYITISHGVVDLYEVSTPTPLHPGDDPWIASGSTIPKAVAALRRQIEEAKG